LRIHSAWSQAHHEAETVQHREWLDKEEILTVPEWLDPADYSDPSEERTVNTIPYVCQIPAATATHSITLSYHAVVGSKWMLCRSSNFIDSNRSWHACRSIDHKVRVREILPGETHEFVGHLFDEQRQERQLAAGEKIRGVERLCVISLALFRLHCCDHAIAF
jgi:hypothetical protein